MWQRNRKICPKTGNKPFIKETPGGASQNLGDTLDPRDDGVYISLMGLGACAMDSVLDFIFGLIFGDDDNDDDEPSNGEV